MPRKTPIPKQTLSTPRRRSPRFLVSPKCTKIGVPKCSNLNLVESISPSKLRRSCRVRKIKETQLGIDGKIDKNLLNLSGLDSNLSNDLCRIVGKRPKLVGIDGKFDRNLLNLSGLDSNLSNDLYRIGEKVTHSDEFEVENGGFDCIRFVGRFENVGRDGESKRVEELRGCSVETGNEFEVENGDFDCNGFLGRFENVGRDGKSKRVEELGVVDRRVTRSGGFRNGSKCEGRGDVECKGGGVCELSEVLGGGGGKDENLERVVEELKVIGKPVARSGGFRNGSKCERNGDVECKRGGGKDENLERVVEESKVISKRVTRSASHRIVDCNGGENRRLYEDLGGGVFKDENSKRVVEESTLIGKRVTRSASHRIVDCNGGENRRLYEDLSGGGFKDQNSKRVIEESTLIGKRVTRSASPRNGNVPLSEHVDDGGVLRNEKMVVRKCTRIAKRVTRSASRRNGIRYDGRNGDVDSNAVENGPLFEDGVLGILRNGKSKRVVEEGTGIAKRVTRGVGLRNGNKNAGDNGPLSEDGDGGGVRNEKSKRVDEFSTRNEKEENAGKKQRGQKRKKTQQKGDCDCSNGWTEEQDVALQKAYFAVKPTPHFWKKVAKMVPGKSAQDCFDRIHSDQKTPQTRKLPRAKRATPASLSFTASKLLNSTTKGSRKSKFSKRNRQIAQKTVRQLLKRQAHVNKDGADLFATLEKTVDPFNGSSPNRTPCFTPKQTDNGLNFLNIRQETCSAADRKQLSRLSTSSGTTLTSPPVLKQIKNMALHEKYIDMLHCREAKRKASLARFAKKVKNNLENNRVCGENIEAVKAAKNALVLDVTEAINQFQQSQKIAADSWDLCDDEMPCSDEDE